MKKRTIKKLELKKKVISDMRPSEIKAGYAGTWGLWCFLIVYNFGINSLHTC